MNFRMKRKIRKVNLSIIVLFENNWMKISIKCTNTKISYQIISERLTPKETTLSSTLACTVNNIQTQISNIR